MTRRNRILIIFVSHLTPFLLLSLAISDRDEESLDSWLRLVAVAVLKEGEGWVMSVAVQ